MSDDIDTKSDAGQKTERRPLSLRRTEKGAVKQSFSHGRTKTVVVETKRRRITAPGAKPARETEAEAPAEAKPAARQEAPKAPAEEKKGAVLRTLSEEEKAARAAALVQARKEEEVRRKREEAERAEREAREAEDRARLEADRKRLAEEEERRTREAEARRKAEEEASRELEEEERERKKRNAAKAEARTKGKEAEEPEQPEAEEDNPLAKLGGRLKTKRKGVEDRRDTTKAKDAPRRRTGRLTIANALDDDDRQRSLASVKRARTRKARPPAARRQAGDRARSHHS